MPLMHSRAVPILADVAAWTPWTLEEPSESQLISTYDLTDSGSLGSVFF